VEEEEKETNSPPPLHSLTHPLPAAPSSGNAEGENVGVVGWIKRRLSFKANPEGGEMKKEEEEESALSVFQE
jgi:hypothetical protein